MNWGRWFLEKNRHMTHSVIQFSIVVDNAPNIQIKQEFVKKDRINYFVESTEYRQLHDVAQTKTLEIRMENIRETNNNSTAQVQNGDACRRGRGKARSSSCQCTKT